MNRTATSTGNRYARATAPAKPRPWVACAFGLARLAFGHDGAALHTSGAMHQPSHRGSDFGLGMEITRRIPA